MNNKLNLSFVLPAYNEAASLKKLTEALLENINKLSDITDYELIFIDDGSKDDTRAVLTELTAQNPHVKALFLRKNCGKSIALQVGFNAASGDIVFTMDTDLQDDPAEISRFIDKINEGFDLVSGWKVKRYDPMEKKFASKIFNTFIARVFKIKLHDFNCGFKAYRRDTCKSLRLFSELHRFTPVLAAMDGFNVTEITVNHHPRENGVSKFGYERYLHGLFDFMVVWFLYFHQNAPMYCFGKAAACTALLGFIALFFSLWTGVWLFTVALLLSGFGIMASYIKYKNFDRNEADKYVAEKIG
ncbi:MAG: glycosyltransferase family 2 protein [Alphaproteobacteria bacterium]|nr:glycosyltransferase family 2 protein [Alphaproteobacteria bacterium]